MTKQLSLGMFTVALIACAGSQGRLEHARAIEREDTLTKTNPQALLDPASVRKMQTALTNQGFSVEKTGRLDLPTTTALRDYQRSEGIVSTGEPDRVTLRKLRLDPNEILRINPKVEPPKGGD